MDGGVFELVLLLAVEDHAVVVYEVEDAGLPEGSAEELHQEVVLPFLPPNTRTSSPSFFGLPRTPPYGYSRFFPNSHSSIDPNGLLYGTCPFKSSTHYEAKSNQG